MGGGASKAKPKMRKTVTEANYLHFYDKASIFTYYIDKNAGREVILTKLTKRAKMPLFPDTVQIDNHIYITGGQNEEFSCLNSTFLFIEDKIEFHEKANMAVSKMHHTMVAVNRELLYSVGGFNWDDYSLSLCEKYSIKKNQWYEAPPLRQRKSHVSVCTFNEAFLYKFGGFDRWNTLNSIERVNVYSEEEGWILINLVENVGWPRKSRWSGGAVQISPNQVLVFGGRSFHEDGEKDAYEENDQSFVFNAYERTMEETEFPMEYPSSFQLCKPVLFTAKGYNEVFIIGEAVIHIYNIQQDQWRVVSFQREYMF
jgi:hypothetical protein